MVNTIHYVNILVLLMVAVKEAMTIHPKSNCCRSQTLDSNEQIKALKELMLSSDNLRPETLTQDPDSLNYFRKSLGTLLPPPVYVNDEILRNMDSQKAYECSLLQCSSEQTLSPVCACNYNTGNVVTFKNECDSKKHNCRFDTAFHVILNEICPWEFQSRRNEVIVSYDDPKYYN